MLLKNQVNISEDVLKLYSHASACIQVLKSSGSRRSGILPYQSVYKFLSSPTRFVYHLLIHLDILNDIIVLLRILLAIQRHLKVRTGEVLAQG